MRWHTAVLFVLDYFKKGRCQRPLYKRSIQRSLSHQSLHLPIGIPFLPHMYFQKNPNLTYYLYKSYLCVVQRRRWPYSHLQEPRRFPNQTCNYLAYGYGQYLISQKMGIPCKRLLRTVPGRPQMPILLSRGSKMKRLLQYLQQPNNGQLPVTLQVAATRSSIVIARINHQ